MSGFVLDKQSVRLCIFPKLLGGRIALTVSSFPEHKRVGRFLDLCGFPGAQGSGPIPHCWFNAIPIKITKDTCVEINTPDSKIYIEMQ